jgi:opacity protein-like surface antigen
MRKFLLGTAALIALASPAISADLRAPVRKAPPPVVVPVWSWSGCYVGGHAGGLWARQKDWIVRTPGGAFSGQSLGGHDADSWLGGAQAGCDYQFAGGFVIGIQGDYAWTDAEGSHDSAREFGVAYHSKVKSLATVTGRIGYAWDQATPGIASSATSRAVAPGSATIIGRRRSYSELLTLRVRRGRDGPSVSVVNTPSPTCCPASSNIVITISAAA